MLRPLRSAPFAYLVAGQSLSQLGDTLLFVGGLWFLQSVSPWLLGVAGIVIAIPSFVSYLGGGLADSLGARDLMRWTEVARGIIIVAAGVTALMVPAAAAVLILLALAVSAFGDSLFVPAQISLVPRLLKGDEDLNSGNGILSGLTRLADMVGRLVGGLSSLAFGVFGLLAFDGLTFLGSAVCVGRLPADAPPPGSSNRRRLAWSDLKAGFDYSRSVGWFFKIVPPAVLINLALSGALLTLPILVQRGLHQGAATYGVLLAIWSAGQFVGSTSAAVMRSKPPRVVCGTAAIVQGLSLLALALTGSIWIAAVALGVASTANGISNVSRTTLMQRLVPSEFRGRVFGLQSTLVSMANPFGPLLATALALSVFPGAIWLLVAAPTLWLAILYWTLPGFRFSPDAPGVRA